MMLPKLHMFVLLMNDGPNMGKRDEHWSMIKHGDEGVPVGNINGASNGELGTLNLS